MEEAMALLLEGLEGRVGPRPPVLPEAALVEREAERVVAERGAALAAGLLALLREAAARAGVGLAVAAAGRALGAAAELPLVVELAAPAPVAAGLAAVAGLAGVAGLAAAAAALEVVRGLGVAMAQGGRGLGDDQQQGQETCRCRLAIGLPEIDDSADRQIGLHLGVATGKPGC